MQVWDPALIWFVVGLLLVLLEFAAPGVVLIFIGFGAWVTAASVKLGFADGFGAQMAWFGASSLVLLVGLRRLFKEWFVGFSRTRDSGTDLDDLAGHEVAVIAAIPPGGRGLVEFRGANWSARLVDRVESLAAGERAVILSVEGLCLVVKPSAS